MRMTVGASPIAITGSKAGSFGARNPFRYRGYYYNPEIRKFINADDMDVALLLVLLLEVWFQ
jgi:hypothetical protein